MRKVMIIALILVGALLVPLVSAEEVLNEHIDAYVDTSATVTYEHIANDGAGLVSHLRFNNIENHPQVNYVIFNGKELPYSNFPDEGQYDITYTLDGVTKPAVMYIAASRNSVGSITSFRYLVYFEDWDIGDLTGVQDVELSKSLGYYELRHGTPSGWGGFMMKYELGSGGYFYRPPNIAHDVIISSQNAFENQIVVDLENGLYNVQILRYFGGNYYQSTVNVRNNDMIVYTNSESIDKSVFFDEGEIDKIDLTAPDGNIYIFPLTGSGEPPETLQPDFRTGTVTMTDNNGTTISGFEVTAVNAYTDEEYTVSTETDVAVMTLPMDRTIEIRNPQTGEYEDAPVGYYRFFGQSPGYKMLYEEGIQVSVMPEKYGSYELCDIRVTSESGYLSGQHQFQIRSRSDNSILQTGTISAKSATTGEWYNTTVTDGIATLVLPYDTSNVQSQYAGNYYVYATSPGFEDSDYATQIVVMPHTASEIRYVLLTPIGGIPTAGNVTLRIQAFSESGQGVANADIFISGVLGEGSSVWDTYTASSTGYLTVSVPGNSTYDIVASGTGYYDSARRVEVFTEDPGLIEIKLYLSGAPTVEPTTQPTGWVTATPTQTSPPIQEDNIIGLSIKGLAKGFGIDYDTALLMFGLMIIFGAGGMVMSSVNGGAMEFIAGSIVGTFVAFALGLIPIWIFIIIAVVFGAYVLRVFIQGGQ